MTLHSKNNFKSTWVCLTHVSIVMYTLSMHSCLLLFVLVCLLMMKRKTTHLNSCHVCSVLLKMFQKHCEITHDAFI